MSKRNTNTTDALANAIVETMDETPDVGDMSPTDRAVALQALVDSGYASSNRDLVVMGVNGAIEAEATNATNTVVLTVRHRVIIGSGLIDLARLDRETKAGGKAVATGEARTAARKAGISADRLGDTVLGYCVRTAYAFAGTIDTQTRDALMLWEVQSDDAPAAWTAKDLLVWSERRQGMNQGSNAGKAVATLGEAKAAKQTAETARMDAETKAKGRRETIAQTDAKAIVVKGLRLTYGQLQALSTETLESLAQTIGDILDTRTLAAKAAKAEAEAKAKAAKAEAEAEVLAIRAAAKAEAEAELAKALATVK